MPKYNRNAAECKGDSKPKKPYPDFPLGPSSNGYWQKRIRGKLFYFGRWGKVVNGKLERLPGDGWVEALARFNDEKDDRYAGREPRAKETSEGLMLKRLCNEFLSHKLRYKKSGEITAQTFDAHRKITDVLIQHFGGDRLVDDLGPSDFATLRETVAENSGPLTLAAVISRVKGVFKYGLESGLIEKAVRYGPEFRKPSAAVLRKNRATNGAKMLEAVEICRVLDYLEGKEVENGQIDEKTGKAVTAKSEPNPVLRAMFLLGANCGFNCKDCADLPLEAIDLDGGWINFPRPKTGIDRRCPLWPETVEALRQAIEVRPRPRQKDAGGRVFVTKRGRAWLSNNVANQVSSRTTIVLKAVGVHRERIGFATLRHVFRTVADGCRDQPAIFHIMGHADASMAGVYRERIEDERLRAVADFVRDWLFGEGGAK